MHSVGKSGKAQAAADRITTVRIAVPVGKDVPIATQKCSIVIADGYPIFRAGLRSTLEADPYFAVVGEAADGRDALRLVRDLTPDVLLLDLAMSGLSGFDVLAEIGQSHPDVKTVLLAGHIDKAEQMNSLRLGARGIVLKGTPADLLRKSIRTVAAGGYWLDRHTVPDLVKAIAESETEDHDVASTTCDLTPRELDIVALVVKGYTNRDIAHQRSIAEDTVKHHVTNIFDKTGVSNRLELALFAIDRGLVEKA